MTGHDSHADTVAAEQRAAKAEQELAVVQNLAMEHMHCSGCPTPWWLKQALGPNSATGGRGTSHDSSPAEDAATGSDAAQPAPDQRQDAVDDGTPDATLTDVVILDAIKAVREAAADERVAMHAGGEPLTHYSSGVLDGLDLAWIAGIKAARRPTDVREVTAVEEWWACEDAYQAGLAARNDQLDRVRALADEWAAESNGGAETMSPEFAATLLRAALGEQP